MSHECGVEHVLVYTRTGTFAVRDSEAAASYCAPLRPACFSSRVLVNAFDSVVVNTDVVQVRILAPTSVIGDASAAACALERGDRRCNEARSYTHCMSLADGAECRLCSRRCRMRIKAFFIINYVLLLKLQCTLHREHLSVHVALLEVQVHHLSSAFDGAFLAAG